MGRKFSLWKKRKYINGWIFRGEDIGEFIDRLKKLVEEDGCSPRLLEEIDNLIGVKPKEKGGGITMNLKIKSWGATKGIIFDKADTELYDLQAGDVVEVRIKKDINWNEMRRRVH